MFCGMARYLFENRVQWWINPQVSGLVKWSYISNLIHPSLHYRSSCSICMNSVQVKSQDQDDETRICAGQNHPFLKLCSESILTGHTLNSIPSIFPCIAASIPMISVGLRPRVLFGLHVNCFWVSSGWHFFTIGLRCFFTSLLHYTSSLRFFILHYTSSLYCILRPCHSSLDFFIMLLLCTCTSF